MKRPLTKPLQYTHKCFLRLQKIRIFPFQHNHNKSPFITKDPKRDILAIKGLHIMVLEYLDISL